MAIATNTITRYDGYRAVREDLANVIYNISPVDVPFMSNIGRENIKASLASARKRAANISNTTAG